MLGQRLKNPSMQNWEQIEENKTQAIYMGQPLAYVNKESQKENFTINESEV